LPRDNPLLAPKPDLDEILHAAQLSHAAQAAEPPTADKPTRSVDRQVIQHMLSYITAVRCPWG